MQAKQQKQQNNLLLLACTRGYTADVSGKQSDECFAIKLLSKLCHCKQKFTLNTMYSVASAWQDCCMLMQAQHLVQTGAQITARDKKGCSTLHFAAAHGQLDIVTYLWSKGAELDQETPGMTLLVSPNAHAPSSLQRPQS